MDVYLLGGEFGEELGVGVVGDVVEDLELELELEEGGMVYADPEELDSDEDGVVAVVEVEAEVAAEVEEEVGEEEAERRRRMKSWGPYGAFADSAVDVQLKRADSPPPLPNDTSAHHSSTRHSPGTLALGGGLAPPNMSRWSLTSSVEGDFEAATAFADMSGVGNGMSAGVLEETKEEKRKRKEMGKRRSFVPFVGGLGMSGEREGSMDNSSTSTGSGGAYTPNGTSTFTSASNTSTLASAPISPGGTLSSNATSNTKKRGRLISFISRLSGVGAGGSVGQPALGSPVGDEPPMPFFALGAGMGMGSGNSSGSLGGGLLPAVDIVQKKDSTRSSSPVNDDLDGEQDEGILMMRKSDVDVESDAEVSDVRTGVESVQQTPVQSPPRASAAVVETPQTPTRQPRTMARPRTAPSTPTTSPTVATFPNLPMFSNPFSNAPGPIQPPPGIPVLAQSRIRTLASLAPGIVIPPVPTRPSPVPTPVYSPSVYTPTSSSLHSGQPLSAVSGLGPLPPLTRRAGPPLGKASSDGLIGSIHGGPFLLRRPRSNSAADMLSSAPSSNAMASTSTTPEPATRPTLMKSASASLLGPSFRLQATPAVSRYAPGYGHQTQGSDTVPPTPTSIASTEEEYGLEQPRRGLDALDDNDDEEAFEYDDGGYHGVEGLLNEYERERENVEDGEKSEEDRENERARRERLHDERWMRVRMEADRQIRMEQEKSTRKVSAPVTPPPSHGFSVKQNDGAPHVHIQLPLQPSAQAQGQRPRLKSMSSLGNLASAATKPKGSGFRGFVERIGMGRAAQSNGNSAVNSTANSANNSALNTMDNTPNSSYPSTPLLSSTLPSTPLDVFSTPKQNSNSAGTGTGYLTPSPTHSPTASLTIGSGSGSMAILGLRTPKKQAKRKLVISGVGLNDLRKYEAVKNWCEVRAI